MTRIDKKANRGQDRGGGKFTVGRARRATGRAPDRRERLEQHDLDRIAGLPAVAALAARAPERIERLFFVPAMQAAAAPFCRPLAEARKPYRMVEADELARIAGTKLHGGIVALARKRPERRFDPAAAAAEAATRRLLLVLDGVANPHNLGAILRTAAYFGLDRAVLSDHPEQAGPSDAAHRVAEGGLEHVTLYRARNLPAALARLKPRYRVLGAMTGHARGMADLAGDAPLALVLGNEERGLDPATLAACDERVTIPGSGRVQSLNVAAAAAILIHDILGRQPR